MQSEGPDTDSGKDEADGGATVLRFPRDWFGPPEELVPFGPRADRSEPRSPTSERDEAGPQRADAFWTEESATVHDAIQVAEPVAPIAPPAPAPRRAPSVLIAAGLAAGVLVVVMLVSSGGDRSARPARTSAAVHWQTWTVISRPPASKRVDRSVKRRQPRQAGPTPARGSNHVVARSESATSSAPPAAPAVSPPASSPPAGGSEAAQSGGSSQPSASAASAAPPSQPAFGANGALGPGHSPNS